MRVTEHPRFKKSYKERVSKNRKLAEAFIEALELFLEDPKNPILRDHALTGSMYGYRSFEAANDLLVVYLVVKKGIVFYDIGNHNQVYSR